MADDLQRFVNDEPIQARRASAVERVARWSRRNPWLATAMSVTAAALVAVAGVSVLAAQNQSRLNNELTAANDEQRETNQALQAKTQEQHKTNEALVATNRINAELIRDLKRSQSRLAEKQAEFVKEKGNLAESMLWLARSYELADSQIPRFRRNLLTKLEASAARMPRLRNVEGTGLRDTSPLFTDNIRERLQEATDEERREIFQELTNSMAFIARSLSPVQSSDQTLVAVPIRVPEGTSEKVTVGRGFNVWDVASASWTGTTIQPQALVRKFGIDSDKRLLAAILWTANKDGVVESDESASTARPQTNGPRFGRGTLTLKVWSIDSGETLVEREIATDVENSRLRTQQRTLLFRRNGTELVSHNGSNGEAIEVRVYSVATGELVSTSAIRPGSAGNFLAQLSRDGERLVFWGLRRRAGAGQFATLMCFDVESGEQVGETIETSTSNSATFNQPIVLTLTGRESPRWRDSVEISESRFTTLKRADLLAVELTFRAPQVLPSQC